MIYTYAFDVSGIEDIAVYIRTHQHKTAHPLDRTYKVYDPEQLAAAGVPHIDPQRVSAWKRYPMQQRSLQQDINGVAWQPRATEVMRILPAQQIGDLYYSYIHDYQDVLLDYYIEATDKRGNVSRSQIQQVYVGSGKYRFNADKSTLIEDPQGTVAGTYPFITPTSP
ncbi:MAG: hypothetical protein OXT67_02350 [Zetaproteobacteria bacterium]|nr:hypothetical protein [Zetaproteobacteria bacterium]